MPEIRHPLHSMCSYLGSFPARLPRRLLKQIVPKGGTVLDPFCGSGTTLVEARLLGFGCVGIDRNPLAVALAKAKMQPVTTEDVEDRIMSLVRGYRGLVDLETVPENVRIIFHPRTLSQLVYLKGALQEGRPEDDFLRGALLGIMHGKRRDGGQDSAYLSIDMPNTFSMSPEYVRRFVKKNKLQQYPVDVFGKLRERVRWLLREGALPALPSARIEEGDATQLPRILARIGSVRPDAIVTSPPYLGVLRYGAFNWIRLWLLGYEPQPVDRRLDSTDSLEKYLSFMSSFLVAAAEVLKPGAQMALVIGDVDEFGTSLDLAHRIWDELRGLTPFDLVGVEVDRFDQTVKTTRIWGDTKGRATPRDRVLVLKRVAASTRKRARGRASAT